MVKRSLGQAWPFASKNSYLANKISIRSNFPDPMSLYSLHAIIIKEEPLHNRPNSEFMPFLARALMTGVTGQEHTYEDWIRALGQFLGGGGLVRYYSETHRKVELTEYGEYMFPILMEAFENMYRQNDRLREAAQTYTPDYQPENEE